ncbi:MAG: hypothetical protein ACRCY9_02035, partial [Phycicoccus sp.]
MTSPLSRRLGRVRLVELSSPLVELPGLVVELADTLPESIGETIGIRGSVVVELVREAGESEAGPTHPIGQPPNPVGVVAGAGFGHGFGVGQGAPRPVDRRVTVTVTGSGAGAGAGGISVGLRLGGRGLGLPGPAGLGSRRRLGLRLSGEPDRVPTTDLLGG